MLTFKNSKSACILLLAISAAAASTAVQADDETIFACMRNNQILPGKIFIDSEPNCTPQEVVVSWSSDGPQGPQGVPGPTGPQGIQGADGLPGANGSQGVAGAVGPAGPTGMQGPVGVQGPEGPAGKEGQPGNDGLPGETGARGSQGPQGEPGSVGGILKLSETFTITTRANRVEEYFLQCPSTSTLIGGGCRLHDWAVHGFNARDLIRTANSFPSTDGSEAWNCHWVGKNGSSYTVDADVYTLCMTE